MPTRFYLPASGTPPVTGSPGSGWETTTGFAALPASRGKGATALADGTARAKSVASASTDRLDRIYISEEQLAAQTISGTFSAVMRALESNALADAWLNIIIRVVSADGSVVRATLYGGTTNTTVVTTTGADNQEFGTTQSTRIKNGLTLSSYTCVAGDRLQFEIGDRTASASTAYTTTRRYGDNILVSDFALTASLTTDLLPWIQLSQDLTFLPGTDRAARFFAASHKYTVTTGMPTSTSYTIMCWGKIIADPNDYQIFFTVYNGSRIIYVETAADGTTLEFNTGGTTAGTGDATGLRTLALGSWYRIALVVDGVSTSLWHGEATGALTLTTASPSPPDQFVPAGISIGVDVNNAYLRGDIAGFKTFNRVLTESELVTEFSSYKSVVTPLAEYTFWGGPSTTDDSGNGRTLTGSGATSAPGPGIPLAPAAIPVGSHFHVLA